jgi:hypothetical protein
MTRPTGTTVGAGVRDRSLRRADNPDPVHKGVFMPLGAVDGRGGVEICGPYEPVVGWPDPAHPGEYRYGSGRAAYAESPDRIVAAFGGEVPLHDVTAVWGHSTFRDLRFMDVNSRHNPGHRHCHEIVEFDRDGHIVADWDQWLDELHANDLAAGMKLKAGHINRIRIDRYDPERHIWLVSAGNGGVFKFTNDGRRLVMKIDARNVPEELHPYVYTQDLAFLPNGDLWIGHQHHLMRFSPSGQFLRAIGGQGSSPAQFDGIHGIEVHPETLDLYVLDRVNQRIQVLDQDGEFRDQWGGFQGAYTIRITADGDYLWSSNGFVHKFMKYDMDGRLVPHSTWGTFGIAPGAIWGPHHFETDQEGNLYVSEDYTGRLQKFRPRPDADPSDPRLVGTLSR